MRAERKAEREARLKMFRRPRDQIVTKWSGTLSHCHEHLRLIKWGHIWFWHGMCDLFVFSLEIGWWMFMLLCSFEMLKPQWDRLQARQTWFKSQYRSRRCAETRPSQRAGLRWKCTQMAREPNFKAPESVWTNFLQDPKP
jgi:hypothetical protein